MNTVIKEITIDVYDENLTEVRAKQYDSKTRSLVITLADEGTAFEVDENATVTMNVRRADNQAKSYFGSVNQDGTVSVPLTYWMLSVYGTAYCDVSIIIGNDMLTSVRFALVIDQAAVQNEDITDDEEYCVLVRLIAEVQDIIDNENSFGTITDGTNIIEAVGVNDLLTLEAGTGVNFTLNPTTKTIRVSITDADTHYHIETAQDTGNDIVIALMDSDGQSQGFAVIKAGANLTGTYDPVSHSLQINAPVFQEGNDHKAGMVPDPGATAGTTKFLCENATWTKPKIDTVSDTSNEMLPVMLGDDTVMSANTDKLRYNSNFFYKTSDATLYVRKSNVGFNEIKPGLQMIGGNDYREVYLNAIEANKDTAVIQHNDTSDDGPYTLALPKKNGTLATDDEATTSAKGLMSAADKQELAQLRADLKYLAMAMGIDL